ncbi:sensor histidine kinase [Streptomyces sp. BI20]|uniref:sensor histidine kinase n=1 Tax=Streptomyces sp. BI20 TaxID=3403460 RepID=UPI003C730E24
MTRTPGTGWWRGRSNAAKVELYTRVTFHALAVCEVLALALGLLGNADAAVRPLGPLVFALAHASMCALVASRALTWTLGRGPRPVRAALALVATTLIGCGQVLFSFGVLGPGTAEGARPGALTTVAVLCVFGVGSLVLCVRRIRSMIAIAVAALAPALGCAALIGVEPAFGLGYALGLSFALALVLPTWGFSRWLLRMAWEAERSRDLAALLAVAEERLRFSRDLHDVMGRNLAAVALKSELAARLAERGRPEAVAQMVEVQRIAREAQREVREVVRGYREVDLTVEMEGARGVLAAAGIDCRIEAPAGERELPEGVRAALGWVVRESTTNVLRHGDAKRCLIRLERVGGGGVRLLVENDGADTGTDGGSGTDGGAGTGLVGLRERLAAVGGELTAGRAHGGLFRVVADVPGEV